ncbi:YncE family protein [Roseobacter sinensis]|uniref:Beta-propeller fold lactonase family protein n=1 Tax=Roseobacter sinensis TaxID=2931391 RepID=A0ABT3BKU8_9RHOB|nr:beta-propeller fold lactonase family protein [Roseobacter sp. WL0113]MCV3274200.1 beta-propeller fold lactonase family protein [Roseobacter sp. WL0113]
MRQGLELAAALIVAATPGPARDLAFVTCQPGDALSVLDIAAGQEIARWAVPGKPAGVAVSPQAVFTVAADSKQVRRHALPSGEPRATVTLDGGPIGIAHDGPRRRLFVSDWYNARIWVLDDQTLQSTGELIVGAAPAGLALSDDGRFLASADRDADQVSIFDASTLALRARLDVGTRPFGLGFAPDGRLFVGNVSSNDVTVIDAMAGQVIATLPVGQRPYGVAFAQGRAFVTNQYADSLSVIDLAGLEPLATLDTGEYPEGIDTTGDSTRIAVANWFDNTVTIFDAKTLSVIEEIETCDGPRAFGTFLLEEKT